MKKLDLYILRKFLTTYLFTVMVLIAVLIVIDLTEKIENFRRPELTVWRIVTEYYLNFIPYLAVLLSPLMIFIAAVFVTSQLATHTEIVAMLSSGMSLGRIMRPYLMGACIVGLFIFWLMGWAIPMSSKVRHNFEDNFVRDKFYFTQRNFHMKLAPDLYAYLESYDNISHVGYRFSLEQIVGLELTKKLEASRISWDSTKRKWTLYQFKVRVLEKGKEKINYFTQQDTLLSMAPKDFESKHNYWERLTIPELDRYINELKMRGSDGIERYLVEKYERIAYPVCVLILTAIGITVSSRKSRGGSGFQIALGFVLAFVYIFFVFISRGFAQTGDINPMLAVWLPNIVFCLLGIFMYYRVPK